MVWFNMVVGISGSGKTTWVHQKADRDVVLDSDALRAELLKNAEDQSQNRRIFQEMLFRSCVFLREGKDVYYTATNLREKTRRETVQKIKEQIPDVHCRCYVICTPFEICVQRNQSRKRTVPKEVLIRQRKSFQYPRYEEGWEEIIRIDNR